MMNPPNNRALACLLSLGAALLAAGCATTPPGGAKQAVDPSIAQYASSARAAYERGDLAHAAAFYERALTRARATESGEEVARTGCNLAACLLMQGEADRARAILREAQAEFVRAGLSPAPALLLAAKAERLAGNPAEARSLVDRAVESGPEPHLLAEAELLLAEMACEGEDKSEARIRLESARKLLGKTRDSAAGVEATWAGVAGHIELLDEHPYAAAVQFDRQVRFLRLSGQFRDMAAALETSGYAYYAANMSADAADRFYRSARARFSQGNAVAALKTLQHALVVAEEAGDDRTFERCTDLLNEIKAAAKTPAAP
jgi:tetratricopeptide (TPR) repeat protein